MNLPDVSLPGALETVGPAHFRRQPWPDFEAFEPEAYDLSLRKRTARQWWRRAREEYGSIHEFSQLAYALSGVRAPLSLLGALSRIITDEARHSHLCATMARTLLKGNDDGFEWQAPTTSWPVPPQLDEALDSLGQVSAGRLDATYRWAADVVLCSCCIGETLSRPLYEALALLITDPVPESVIRQILKDEQLHATFGWECLAYLLTVLDDDARAWLETRISSRFRSFERSCVGQDKGPEDFVGAEIELRAPTPDAPPNLGLNDRRTYAIIFYDCIEQEIIPRFEELGFDATGAWHKRRTTAKAARR